MIARPKLLVLLVALALAGPAMASGPPPIDAGGVTGLDLQTQLEKGLRARRPVEFAYIAEIIMLVEEGKLPYKLVATTFTWAQKKPDRKLEYFQFALEVRARRLHVNMPDLRRMAVGISSNGGVHGVNTPPIPPN